MGAIASIEEYTVNTVTIHSCDMRRISEHHAHCKYRSTKVCTAVMSKHVHSCKYIRDCCQ